MFHTHRQARFEKKFKCTELFGTVVYMLTQYMLAEKRLYSIVIISTIYLVCDGGGENVNR